MRALLAASLIVSALPLPLLAQSRQTAKPVDVPPVTSDADALRKLTWRSIGPANNAGRISVVVGVPGDVTTYYVAGAAGGIAKTTNGGTTFKQIFDKQDVASIGAIAIAPSDANVLYVGTGEGNPRNSASFGNGVYKSTDGGNSWTHLGLTDTDKIPRIVIDPRNPDIVYVCALGHEWGPNEERGLFKTTDGGKTWSKILYRNTLTGCSDVDIDPTNANVVYAGMYSFRRWAWYFESGGNETALYKSIDGGATWNKLSKGLPTGPMDRIGVSVSRSEPNVVYMVTEAKDEGELYRSDDAGDSWRVVNKDPNIDFRPFYYSDIRVDPSNSNRIFSLSGALYLSEDGGRTFNRIANSVHGDHQAMWIDPQMPKRVIGGSDGGWHTSFDGGKTWEVVNTIAFTQFYHVAYDMQEPYHVCGGLQDNMHWCGPSNSLSPQGIRKVDWVTFNFGDGFFAVPDLASPWLVYSATQGGNIVLTDLRTGDERSIHPYPNRIGSAGDAMENHKYRFNWNSPIALSPFDPKTVYFGGNVLFRTRNYGQSWDVISPDLSTNDKAKQKSSGGPVVVDNTAAEFHSTILSIAPSPKDSNLIWIGTDDGNVQLTRDAGKTWTNVIRNVQGLAPNAWIATVEASPSDAGTAYFAASHHQDNDYAPYFFMTTDYGKTWKKLTNGLPAKGWAHVIREDPRNRNLLYAGTENGLYASWNRGERWVSIRNNIAAVPVRDLTIHPRDNDVIVATHGRGMYILDDATPLQRLADATAADVYLFDVRPATRWVLAGRDGDQGQKQWTGQNPPQGAIISYYLKSPAKDSVSITIADAGGRVLRTLRSPARDSGVNRAVWDLRLEPPKQLPDTTQRRRPPGADDDEDESSRFNFGGPFVLPGVYVATLTANGRTLSTKVSVRADPRTTVTVAQLKSQQDAALAIRELMSRATSMLEQTDGMSRQLASIDQTLRPGRGSGDSVFAVQQGASSAALEAINAARTKLKSFRDDKLARPIAGLGYRQYPRLRDELNTLGSAISRPESEPTDPQMLRLRELTDETAALETELQAIVLNEVAKVNQLLAGTPHVVTAGPRKPIP
ncbi:MAG TPA: hypothetical protein VJ867_16070 [Gemmatimonadaceae bacterium]|nr:hypothetical protein [Gemmatimonadaceae bacterium]